jgi:hypothetical protein
VPVVPVLIAAGVVDAISGSPLSHGALLIAVALGLAVDTVRRRTASPAAAVEVSGGAEETADAVLRGPEPALPQLRLTPKLFLAGLAYAVVAGTFARSSWPATISVMLPGAAAIVLAWRTPAAAEVPRIERVGGLAWASVFLALALLELSTLLLQPDLVTMSYAHPTISFLMESVLASHAGRSLTLFLWAWFGWFLLER